MLTCYRGNFTKRNGKPYYTVHCVHKSSTGYARAVSRLRLGIPRVANWGCILPSILLHLSSIMLTLLAIAAIVPSVVLSVPTVTPISPCADAHIIAARASTEPPGSGRLRCLIKSQLLRSTEGIIGSLVNLVQTNSQQTVSNDSVNDPATLTTLRAQHPVLSPSKPT
jgi:hypothetical protein